MQPLPNHIPTTSQPPPAAALGQAKMDAKMQKLLAELGDQAAVDKLALAAETAIRNTGDRVMSAAPGGGPVRQNREAGRFNQCSTDPAACWEAIHTGQTSAATAAAAAQAAVEQAAVEAAVQAAAAQAAADQAAAKNAVAAAAAVAADEAVAAQIASEQAEQAAQQDAAEQAIAALTIAEPAAGAVSPTDLSVMQWLVGVGLNDYAGSIVEDQGYDQLEYLVQASEDDVNEIVKDASMKKPHGKKFVKEWKKLVETAASAPIAPGGGGAVATAAVPVADLKKFTSNGNSIRMGKAEDATHGLQVLLGATGPQIGSFLQDPEAAIKREFMAHGTSSDKQHYADIINGTFHGNKKTLDQLLAHPDAKMAKLERHHILVLRLYTTSSYSRINDPLRQDPPERPHPFAATTYFIDDGIKKLRAVAASSPNAQTMKVFWRGLKDLTLPMEFVQKGGTEFGCMSTSEDKKIAVKFAASKCPLILKYESKDFANRGADVSFLSVYPHEKEGLFPPLTYLRVVKIENEELGGVTTMVATVEPVFF